jgi:uncharacterized protein YgfB (UPF0149 family)
VTKINLKAVQKAEPIPAGTYDATFTDFEKKKNNDGDGDHFSAQFTVTDDEYAGRKVYRNYSLKTDSLPYFKQFMARLGADEDALEDEAAEIEDILNDLKGADCRVKVRVRVYQGEARNDVQSVLSATFEDDDAEDDD